MSSDEDEELGGEEKGEQEAYPYGEYIGDRDADLRRHGFGSALLPNNDIYEGQYYRGKRHGKGLYVFRNGARYDGMWRKNLKHGQGTFYYPDGSKYVGDWWKDQRSGLGTYYYPNGDYYEGAWFRHERHGLGSYTYSELGIKFMGTWRVGRMLGPGQIIYPDYVYHGKFERNLPIGPGVFSFRLKVLQLGHYVNLKDPAFDYIAEEVEQQGEGDFKKEPEEKGAPRGIVPIWRARNVVAYSADLMPPEPIDFPLRRSTLSLLDIIEYLEKQYGESAYLGGEEEEEYHDDIMFERLVNQLKRLDPVNPISPPTFD